MENVNTMINFSLFRLGVACGAAGPGIAYSVDIGFKGLKGLRADYLGGVTCLSIIIIYRMLPHLSGVPHLHVNSP